MKYLHSYGNSIVEEFDLDKPECPVNGILVKTKLVGVCRSDINQYLGNEEGVPFGMFGHEGLGQVAEIGPSFKSDRGEEVKVGDYVSTWSDPAYGDYYPAQPNEFVIIPEADPKYILQPVACAANIYRQTKKFMKMMEISGPILVLGSGFMSTVIAELAIAEDQEIAVVGKANAEIFEDLGVERFNSLEQKDFLEVKRKVVIDISSKADYFYSLPEIVLDGGLIAYAGTPTENVVTNFFENCWQCHTFIMPSPRNADFNDAMAMSRDFIMAGELDTARLWSEGYDRKTDFKHAFEDGANRPKGYLRGYLQW